MIKKYINRKTIALILFSPIIILCIPSMLAYLLIFYFVGGFLGLDCIKEFIDNDKQKHAGKDDWKRPIILCLIAAIPTVIRAFLSHVKSIHIYRIDAEEFAVYGALQVVAGCFSLFWMQLLNDVSNFYTEKIRWRVIYLIAIAQIITSFTVLIMCAIQEVPPDSLQTSIMAIGAYFAGFFLISFIGILVPIIRFSTPKEKVQTSPQTQTQTRNNTNSNQTKNVIAASKLIQSAHSKIYVGKYEEAIADINAAIRLCPLDRDYHSLLGSTQEKIRKRDAERERERELIRKREEERRRERAEALQRQRELWNKASQQKQTPEEQIREYIKLAKEYFNDKDFKNAKDSIYEARKLDKNNLYSAETWQLLCNIETTEKNFTAHKLAEEAENNMRLGKYQKAIECAREAMELVGTRYYSDYYKKVYAAFEEHKRQGQQKERQTKDEYTKQAEAHYNNAVKYHNDKNYRAAEKEIDEAIRFAKCAGIVSNKFVILKNKILSNKKTTSNTRNNNVPRYETNRAPAKNDKQVNHYEGFGILNDECDEAIPQSIAEIIAKKSGSQSSYNTPKENMADKQKRLNESNPDELIKVIEDFITMGTYKNAYDYIEKARKIIDINNNKKYAEKLDLLSEKITLATFEPALAEMLRQNDYKSAIKQLKSFIENKPNNQLFDKKLKEIENLYEGYKKLEGLYNEAVNLYENKDYKAALSVIDDAVKLSKNKELSTANFEKLKAKVEAEEIYQAMLKIYESDNIDYDLIIKKLQYAITEKYSNERYTNFLKKVVLEYNTIQEKNYYNAADKDYQNENYTSALTNIDKALKLNSKNKTYTDLKKKINAKLDEIKKNKEFDKFYKIGTEAYNNAEFTDAAENFKKALELKSDNNECQKLLEKARSGKIDIMTCTNQALLTLDFISRETVENIIKARNNGEMWYDYQLFAQQFDIMPHLWPDVEEKITFPLKQANKYGRRLDI